MSAAAILPNLGLVPEIAVAAIPSDERVWVPQAPDDCREMITFFNISGAMIYLDQAGRQMGYEDVFSKIEMCRRHYGDVGLGADYVDQFIR